MADLTKRRVRLVMDWSKDRPGVYQWHADCWAFMVDDSMPGGERLIRTSSEVQEIDRETFQGLTGAQIVNNAVAAANAALQALGSGAGSHEIIDDLGDE